MSVGSRPLRLGIVVAAVIAAGLAARTLRVHATAHGTATQRYEDVYYLPPAEWLPAMSLGHEEALADLLWMRALIYFGDELEHRGRVRHVFGYADAILELDPGFRDVYRWAGTVGMYRPAGHTAEDVREAVAYLERAVRQFPDDGELAWDLGASYAYELAPLIEDEEEKERLRELGVEHMQAAARLSAGPHWLVLSNATQLERLGRTEQAIRHLEEMYAYVDDPDTRRQIEIRLEMARSQAYAEAFRRFHEEQAERHRRDFPYLDATLYLLVGPRPPVEPEDVSDESAALD